MVITKNRAKNHENHDDEYLLYLSDTHFERICSVGGRKPPKSCGARVMIFLLFWVMHS
jgi:hypothetical protein